MTILKNYTRPIIAAVLVLLTIGVSACDHGFEAVNSNPNEPEQVNPGLLLPNVIREPVNNSVNFSMTTGNIVAQHTAKVLFGSIDRYDWTGQFEGFWSTNYDALRNTENMINIAEESNQPGYKGIAIVMRAWVFSMLTDAYGDIPYSEALKAKTGDEYSPIYDPQEKVYESMVANLKQANTLLKNAGDREISGDILFHGDLMKWRKFANSLRLRLLLHASKKWDVASDFQEILNNPSEYPVFESNEDNAALTYLNSYPNQWPVHTWRVGTFQEYRMSKTLVDTLKKFDDPRLKVYADPTDNSVDNGDPKYVGVPNGLHDDEAANYNGSPSDQSRLDARYFQEANAAKGLIMTYSELLFIKAEAAQRGWISGDAQVLYEDAIKASFEQYGVEVPAGYFSQPDVAYDAQTGLRQILDQKWIALYFTGLESWFEWRRTGYPDLEPSVRNVNSDRIPVRFMYPAEEQSLNQTNYKKAVDSQGPDNINTPIWLIE